jgi:hypothetical protein
MNPKTSSRALIILSIAYGIAVAVLGSFDSPALRPVAIVGALVVGGLWAVRGVLSERKEARR